MTTLLHRAALGVTLLLTGMTTVQAQQSETASTPKDWYAVEVIVFKQWEAGGADAELWPVDPPLPAASHGLRPLNGPADRREPFSPLSSASFELGGVEQRLSQSDAYRVLDHFGWIQPGLDQQQAPAVALPLNWLNSPLPPSGADDNGSPSPFTRMPAGTDLFGTLRVYRNRYLHVEADLRYAPNGYDPSAVPSPGPADAPQTTADGEPDSAAGDDDAAAYQPSGNGAQVYVLRQDQRIHSGDIVYLDHPAMGVIIQVRPLPAADSGQ